MSAQKTVVNSKIIIRCKL